MYWLDRTTELELTVPGHSSFSVSSDSTRNAKNRVFQCIYPTEPKTGCFNVSRVISWLRQNYKPGVSTALLTRQNWTETAAAVVLLNVGLGCRFSDIIRDQCHRGLVHIALRPRKPEGSLGRTAAQDPSTLTAQLLNYGLKQPGCFGNALTRQNYETGCFNVLTRQNWKRAFQCDSTELKNGCFDAFGLDWQNWKTGLSVWLDRTEKWVFPSHWVVTRQNWKAGLRLELKNQWRVFLSQCWQSGPKIRPLTFSVLTRQ